MQLTGEELLALYLLEHPGDNDGVDEVGETIIPTATLLEHALLTQGFMGGSKAGFLHSLQPQNRDSTRANLANTQK